MDDRIFKNLLLTKLVFWKFWKSAKFVLKSANFLVLFNNVLNEKMFTNELEDGCEAPLKPDVIETVTVQAKVHNTKF